LAACRPSDFAIAFWTSPAEVERFFADVLAHPPTFARVERVERETLAPRGASGFSRAPTA
jgi:hypothetical protein